MFIKYFLIILILSSTTALRADTLQTNNYFSDLKKTTREFG